MRFEKYHGLGNDFIIYNIEDVRDRDFSELAIKSCHRNLGIGADGMIIYEKDTNGMIVMNFYNADGSTAPMCGNGIRCFAHYLKDNNHFDGDVAEIKTGAGILTVTIESYEDKSKGENFLVRVNMGRPRFEAEAVPMNIEMLNARNLDGKSNFVENTITIDGKEIIISSLFMGTTHTVVFVDDLSVVEVEKLGRKIEKSEMFPVGTNVNFTQIVSDEKILVTTWERGAGLTLACGTGACAAVVVSDLLGKVKDETKIEIKVPGGNLYIEVQDDVFMTGPSEQIASGDFLL